jgi:hypothetical protein
MALLQISISWRFHIYSFKGHQYVFKTINLNLINTDL